MKFLKVGYSRTFPLEQFGNEKPFVEVEVGEGESPMDALASAKKLVYEFHEQTLAELKAKHETQVTKTPTSKLTVVDEINKCTSIEELHQWRLFSETSKDPLIRAAYRKKLTELI